ncbi:hypothetical protein [Neobacillus driksii]
MANEVPIAMAIPINAYGKYRPKYSEMINLDYSVSYFTPFNPYSHKYRKK